MRKRIADRLIATTVGLDMATAVKINTLRSTLREHGLPFSVSEFVRHKLKSFKPGQEDVRTVPRRGVIKHIKIYLDPEAQAIWEGLRDRDVNLAPLVRTWLVDADPQRLIQQQGRAIRKSQV